MCSELLLFLPQPSSPCHQRDKHKRDGDPGEGTLISGKANRQEGKAQDKKNRRGSSAGLFFLHIVIIHKLLDRHEKKSFNIAKYCHTIGLCHNIKYDLDRVRIHQELKE